LIPSKRKLDFPGDCPKLRQNHPSMFTGIIEQVGTVLEVFPAGTGLSFWIGSSISSELRVDQSLSHDGACLTVEALRPGAHRVTAVLETLEKTALRSWTPGKKVNLERAMVLGGRLDGHLVQGHVDGTGSCLSHEDQGGSWLFRFSYPEEKAGLMIEKGSITVNGISLTAFDISNKAFSVAIIPYTIEHTNLSALGIGQPVNLEFDLIGKYILRQAALQKPYF
jgi:riboflavin synthase